MIDYLNPILEHAYKRERKQRRGRWEIRSAIFINGIHAFQ